MFMAPAVFIRKQWPRGLAFYCRFMTAVIPRDVARFPKLETETRMSRDSDSRPGPGRGREGRGGELAAACRFGRALERLSNEPPRCPRCLFLTSGRKPSPAPITLTRRAEISRGAPGLIMARVYEHVTGLRSALAAARRSFPLHAHLARARARALREPFRDIVGNNAAVG